MRSFDGDELHVVDEQRVGGAVPRAEPLDRPVLQRRDQLVDEELRAHARHASRRLAPPRQLVADRVEQVRLPHAARPHEKERVVAMARLGDHGVGRAHGHLVRAALLEACAREGGLRSAGRHGARERVLHERHRFAEPLGIAKPLVAAELRIDAW